MRILGQSSVMKCDMVGRQLSAHFMQSAVLRALEPNNARLLSTCHAIQRVGSIPVVPASIQGEADSQAPWPAQRGHFSLGLESSHKDRVTQESQREQEKELVFSALGRLPPI